jgi:cytoskeletal protein CcmA (bactofilin family)
MPPLEFVIPVAILTVIALMHWAYYCRHENSDSQQVIDIQDLTAKPDEAVVSVEDARTPEPGARRLSGAFVALTPGRGFETVEPSAFELATAEIAAGMKRRVYLSKALRAQSEQFVDVLICADDVIVEGDAVFHSSVKIAGDLVVRGSAVFMKPVIVNGFVRIKGRAAFRHGLVAKEDAVVSGEVTIGAADTDGWLVARKVSLEGGLLLNGSVETREGLHYERIAA